ncbi:MAG TPA: aldo/keto reductase [Gemmatimonadaceae bacterium]|nr:aldo/keto reductase [Gemmatimonadaceae bacterium]
MPASTDSTARPALKSGTFDIGDKRVHRLGFGAMRITGKGIWGPPKDRKEAINVLRRAVDLGVDLIDTADSYGPHVSEEIIAEALYPYPKGLVIATKGGLERPGPDQWEMNGQPAHLRKACEGSLKRLRLDRIDLYQLHRIDPKVPAEDQIGTLRDLQQEGKIAHVGLSEVGIAELEMARSIVPIVTVQNRYNLVDRAYDQMVEHCERVGVGFIPWFPLATGKLAAPGGPLARAAERLNATPSQVAIAWLLARSPVMLPIPGTSSVRHLEENMGGALLTLSDEELRALSETKTAGA